MWAMVSSRVSAIPQGVYTTLTTYMPSQIVVPCKVLSILYLAVLTSIYSGGSCFRTGPMKSVSFVSPRCVKPQCVVLGVDVRGQA